jgi:hypothetical protein
MTSDQVMRSMNGTEIENPSEHDQDESQPAESYFRPALLALALYFVLWAPGFLVNAVYLSRALGDRQRTGQSPEGMGCLIALMAVGFGGPVIGVCVLLITSLGEVG